MEVLGGKTYHYYFSGIIIIIIIVFLRQMVTINLLSTVRTQIEGSNFLAITNVQCTSTQIEQEPFCNVMTCT